MGSLWSWGFLEPTLQAGGIMPLVRHLFLPTPRATWPWGEGGIVSGMSPQGGFDLEGAEMLIGASRRFQEIPPGRVQTHFEHTGFFREVYDTEEGVLEAIRRCVSSFAGARNDSFGTFYETIIIWCLGLLFRYLMGDFSFST